MKLFFLATLLAVLCAASASGQSIRTLGYNTTNGQVIYSGTNTLTFTNGLGFTSGAAGATRTNLSLGATWLTNGNVTNFRTAIGLPLTVLTNTNVSNFKSDLGLGSFDSSSGWAVLYDANGNAALDTEDGIGLLRELYFFATNAALHAATTRTNLGLPLPALTNTNVTNFRTAIGLGATNNAEFETVVVNGDSLTISGGPEDAVSIENESGNLELNRNSAVQLSFDGSAANFFSPIAFDNSTNAATSRTNLSLPLQTLTNTSNVTIMRALAGSTNTNQPFSGSFNVTDDNSTTRTIVVSNGIIVSADEY